MNNKKIYVLSKKDGDIEKALFVSSDELEVKIKNSAYQLISTVDY